DCYEAPALLVKKEGKTEIRFLHRDYLGSILQVADNEGNIIEENSFDAWGSRRAPDTQEIYTGTEVPSLMTGRGFTGHEHLDGFGLVHMNARLYDPILGRFLSPDPYVQLPDFTQAMNRYGYCMNRPLCYVDKNGEIIGWIIAGALIGGAINVATHWDNISNFGQFLGYFGVGAAAGALGPLVGGAVGGAGFIGGAISGMVGGAASGFTLGTGNTLMAGGGFLNALGNGTMGAFSGAICGGALGGVIGGGTAIAKGQNFWHGNTIAQGRGMFSWKNTPVGETGSLNSVPDAMPKMPKPDTPLASSPQPSIGSNEKISNIAKRLKPGLQPVTNTQEVRVTLIEGDLKIHFRVETHTGVNNVFKDMNLHSQDYVRHANIELFYLRDGKWIRTPIPGTKVENFHIFLNLVNKYIK
ncbi:RHS repeat-associated core domain-containing protein, partial [Phocaeicola coprocola]